MGCFPFSVAHSTQDAFEPLLPLVKNYTQSNERAIEVGEMVSRPELERQVINSLLQRDSRFREKSEAWSALALQLKSLSLSDASPEAIVDELAAQMEALAV
jgi:hypothetical protein